MSRTLRTTIKRFAQHYGSTLAAVILAGTGSLILIACASEDGEEAEASVMPYALSARP